MRKERKNQKDDDSDSNNDNNDCSVAKSRHTTQGTQHSTTATPTPRPTPSPDPRSLQPAAYTPTRREEEINGAEESFKTNFKTFNQINSDWSTSES